MKTYAPAWVFVRAREKFAPMTYLAVVVAAAAAAELSKSARTIELDPQLTKNGVCVCVCVNEQMFMNVSSNHGGGSGDNQFQLMRTFSLQRQNCTMCDNWMRSNSRNSWERFNPKKCD